MSDYLQPPLSSPRRGSYVTFLVALVALGVALWLVVDRFRADPIYTDAEPRAIEPRGELADFEKVSIAIFENNVPSVVYITSPKVVRRTAWGTLTALPKGAGTGFVWDARGYIVTNYHVVQGRRNVIVRLPGLKERRAAVVGADPDQDIAVVKLEDPPSGLRAILVGTSKDLRVGQAVFAIGNPFGLDYTFTTGVVSALDRVISSVGQTQIRGVIQVDAAINPGNSGGPLLDSAGRLIGMNTAIYSPSGASAGIGFAVPVDTVNRVVPRLIRGDKGGRPVLGVILEYSIRYDGRRHPMISRIVEGSGAADAGLRGMRNGEYGDVLLSIDGEEVNSVPDIAGILDQREQGDVVSVKVLRIEGGERQILTFDVTLKTTVQR